MIPLNITYVRHAVPGCCKGNATGVERLCYGNESLISDECLPNGCSICKECDMCLVQAIEVIINWFSAMMWGAIKMSNSPVGGASEFPRLPESVDQRMCRTGTFSYKYMLNVLLEQRVLGGRLWRPTWNSFPGSKRVVNKAVVSLFLCP